MFRTSNSARYEIESSGVFRDLKFFVGQTGLFRKVDSTLPNSRKGSIDFPRIPRDEPHACRFLGLSTRPAPLAQDVGQLDCRNITLAVETNNVVVQIDIYLQEGNAFVQQTKEGPVLQNGQNVVQTFGSKSILKERVECKTF